MLSLGWWRVLLLDGGGKTPFHWHVGECCPWPPVVIRGLTLQCWGIRWGGHHMSHLMPCTGQTWKPIPPTLVLHWHYWKGPTIVFDWGRRNIVNKVFILLYAPFLVLGFATFTTIFFACWYFCFTGFSSSELRTYGRLKKAHRNHPWVVA